MTDEGLLLYPRCSTGVRGLSALLKEKLEKGEVEFEAGGYIGNDGRIEFTHVALVPVKDGEYEQTRVLRD